MTPLAAGTSPHRWTLPADRSSRSAEEVAGRRKSHAASASWPGCAVFWRL